MRGRESMGGGGGGHAWRGACMAGGMHGEGMHGRGACVVEGACMAGGHAWSHMHTPPPTPQDTVGQCMGGTHPTGMHSCLEVKLFQLLTL